MCVPECMSVFYVHAEVHRSENKAPKSLELEIQRVVNGPVGAGT